MNFTEQAHIMIAQMGIIVNYFEQRSHVRIAGIVFNFKHFDELTEHAYKSESL